jgi:hypothetical protein
MPSRSPGPRNDLIEVRLALSNDALNTKGIFSRSAISRSCSAIASVKSCDSITQGPAIQSNGWPGPTLISPMETVCAVATEKTLHGNAVRCQLSVVSYKLPPCHERLTTDH